MENSEIIAIVALFVSVISALIAARSSIKVERTKNKFQHNQNQINILQEFQSYLKTSLIDMDNIASQRVGDFMDEAETMLVIKKLQEVNERYREISYAFTKQSQSTIAKSLEFIGNQAGTPEAFQLLQELPQLYKKCIVDDLNVLFEK